MSEIRRANLRLLLAEAGGLAELNRRRGASDRDSTLSQIVNGSPDSKTGRPRQMGDRLARSLEVATGHAPGWMDAPHDEPSSPTARSAEQVAAAAAGGMNSRIADLLTRASPKSQGALERIAQAAAAGKLTDADLELLEQIAKRFEAK